MLSESAWKVKERLAYSSKETVGSCERYLHICHAAISCQENGEISKVDANTIKADVLRRIKPFTNAAEFFLDCGILVAHNRGIQNIDIQLERHKLLDKLIQEYRDFETFCDVRNS